MIPVVLSGGSGTRLWPLSRSQFPKQFHALGGGDFSLLQETLRRLSTVDGVGSPVVVSNQEHRFMVAEQLRQLGVLQPTILLEPFGRNTAPAVALAAINILKQGGEDTLMLVLPADHVIRNSAAFAKALSLARPAAERGALVTFGIVAHRPETGFGYIRREDAAWQGLDGVYPLASFKEKPDLETAKSYIAGGDYFWNSGMFMFSANRYLEELEKYAPDILVNCRNAHAAMVQDFDFLRITSDSFGPCRDESIDYAVMEHTDSAVVIPLDADWNDVGSWQALWEIGEQDGNGNVCHGDVINTGSRNCYIYGEQKLIATLGLENLVVVDTDDALLIADKSMVQDVKLVVDELKRRKRTQVSSHRKVYRPWGFYDSIDMGERHQAKRIVLKPGAKLSLQLHHHRAEHWIIVSGTARVTKGEESFLLSENQSTFIPVGTVHCLENPGVIPVVMIEVQSGSYLGEDDIVRFQDNYGRV
ncbi:mannose-1-phosphate guanylyltransferase/mannose-6-phosphate isomerase [Fluviicoccus sp.]|uniref:mannose-1-phosphate guanylyltransferase/mannose-6-phosphate isomerase n=1 Tax=Fluviicoccus sp. TaxID=2003552 RepID=UPI00351EA2BA